MSSYFTTSATHAPVKKPSLFAALFRKAMCGHSDKGLNKQNTETRASRQSLIWQAPRLDAKIESARSEAQMLFAVANANPRPTMPPNREELFQELEGAPESRYGKDVRTYNENVQELKLLLERVTVLEERVANFKADSKALADAHAIKKAAAKKDKGTRFAKIGRDLESVEKAAKRMGMEMEKLDLEVATASWAMKWPMRYLSCVEQCDDRSTAE